MRQFRASLSHVIGALLLALMWTTSAEADSFRGLKPGAFEVLDQKVPVNVVFVGYERDDIDLEAIKRELPAIYKPVVRYPQFYRLNGRDMGLAYRFKYTFDFTNSTFEKRFFAYLTAIGVEGAPTAFQSAYNDQIRNVVDVTGPVLYIDAPKVERYLQQYDGERRQGYTIYFVNWYGRDDFRFHVYSKTDEVDPDTRINFGARGSRQMIAWGGSSSRTWFYDLSAGPESWTNNWIVDDDQSEYHMPPIWEYATPGYRPPSQVSQDLGLVARYVGIDLLFTTSPLYDPLVTAPEPGGGKVAHVAMLQEDPASNGLSYFNADFMKRQLRLFQPYYSWTVGVSNTNPIDPGAKLALDIFAGTVVNRSECWGPYGDIFAQLYCYFDANLGTYTRATRGVTTWVRSSPTTSATPAWATTSSACSASPTTTGSTARSRTCSCSTTRPCAPRVTASRRPACTSSGITSACRTHTTATIPSRTSTSGRRACSSSRGRATRARP